MLPLTLLKAAQGSPMLVEVKTGETYNGELAGVDNMMNLCLREVIITSKDGEKFWSLPEVFIRGSAVKYIRIPDDVLEKVPADAGDAEASSGRGRGYGPGRGRGGAPHAHGGGRGGRGGARDGGGRGAAHAAGWGGGGRGGGGRGGGGRGGGAPRGGGRGGRGQ